MVGDLKFTIGADEIWGVNSHLDPLAHFFTHLIENNYLVDMAPTFAGPTWRNGRAGVNGISKRLDSFLISSSLIPFLHHHWMWSTPSDVSDHYLICLEWAVDTSVSIYPFKLNRA